jgi:hypothetical protein
MHALVAVGLMMTRILTAWRSIGRSARAALPALALVVIAVLLAAAARNPLAGPAFGPGPRAARAVPVADSAAAPASAEASPRAATTAPGAPGPRVPVATTVAAFDELLAARWQEAGIDPAGPADELTVLRRAWLALAGTIPSVEEIRRFEADRTADRVDRWIALLLADRRAADHLARRLARSLVGDAEGQFIVFRRDRFTDWLAGRLEANEPFDRVVTAMLAHGGLWTEAPEVNFITQAMSEGTLDANVLTARVSRVLLGQRIDCAQCHDHPFAPFTQAQYEGLAACFGQVRVTGLGVEDDPVRVLSIDLPPAAEGTMAEAPAGMRPMAPRTRKVPPRAPFGAEWWPAQGTHRQDLAAWIVDPRNRRFHRAVVNRCVAIVFGRAWHEPVDDLPDPPAASAASDPLDLLADDFRDHGCDLRRLLSILVGTRLFHLSSGHPLREDEAGNDAVDGAWAAFPITPVGPDAMISSLVQATSLRTIDRDSHLVTRTIRFFREVDFLREYGRTDDANGRPQPATIPQTLVRMNGRLARELVEANPFTATGRIAGLAGDDRARCDLAFLAMLTRYPTTEERTALRDLLASAPTRGQGMEDLCWVLMNSVEFGWNH